MKITEIYSKYPVPPNLAEHMCTVAGVVCCIQDHWTADEIDWEFVVIAALLHDIGNIVKFDFDKHPEFLGEEARRIDYWKRVRYEAIEKYGKDDHIASGNILREIGVSGNLLQIIQDKSFANAVDVAQENDWVAKILLYADMRVMPHGVVALDTRLADVRKRMPHYTCRPDFELLISSMHQIEKGIQSRLCQPIGDIDWQSSKDRDKAFLNLDPQKIFDQAGTCG
jgi:hypothetical protein